jgi:hypothetical protein
VLLRTPNVITVTSSLNLRTHTLNATFYIMSNPIPQIIPSEKIQAYSRYFVEEFIKKADGNPYFAIDFSFYPTRKAYETKTSRAFIRPVYSEKREKCFTIHICEDSLKNIPSLALQGWMEHETMRCIQRLHPEFDQFNFKKNIFPLMPVTGLAENHMLELIQSIEKGLKKYLATKAITDMGGGFQQAHFYFFRIIPIVEDRAHYQRVLPHSWTKALFLCRKFRELMPIYWLADQKVEFSQDLASFWWRVHDYLTPKDKTFLKELAGIPHGYSNAPYSDIVIELFKKVKSQYLLSHKDVPKPASPPPTLH